MTKFPRAVPVFLFLAVMTAPAVLVAQETADLTSLDQSIQSTIADWNIPGAAISIVRNQSVVYIKGFGVREIHGSQAITPDTLFQIGSCTKAFTSAVIAMLVDQGKMEWDGRVNTYLPFFHLYDPEADEHVTVRDLLTHRTGLPGADLVWYGTTASREDLLRRVAHIAPGTAFRTHFEYQNLMFLAAGEAAGHAADSTWDDLVRSRIFAPLGMNSSTTSTNQAQKSLDHATPHTQSADGSVKTVPWRNLDNIAPAGSIVSNAREMAKWVTLQLNDGMYGDSRLISKKNMQEMHSPQMVIPRTGGLAATFFPDSTQLSYGLGWFVQDYRGHQLILHPGDIDGFAALVVLIPEIHTGYFLVINSTSLGRQVLGYRVADKLLNLPDADWSARFHKLQVDQKAEEESRQAWQSKRTPGTHPSHELSAYTGRFENPAYGDAEISLDNGKLVLHFHSVASNLDHFQYDTFVTSISSAGKTRLTFSLNEQGEVEKFVVLGISFQRSAPSPHSRTSGQLYGPMTHENRASR
jgi:CubicO group peptidase (beta-lactamase class C family)